MDTGPRFRSAATRIARTRTNGASLPLQTPRIWLIHRQRRRRGMRKEIDIKQGKRESREREMGWRRKGEGRKKRPFYIFPP
ncbi:hypothetical protein PUN28_015672 [Cardiocondyla obscurior]|uniref:Uncharacterized protein n=1 Tax=Cardiocondyla obscurior TaxID=286306 RepID=A0AAW2EZ90_9HYME